YTILTLRDSVVTNALVVSEEQFMYQALGYYPSLANPKKENLFVKHGVDSCFLVVNEIDKVIGYYAKPFYDLWKLRFYEHPMEFDMKGWSQDRIKPSAYQMKLLYEQSGVNNVLTHYFSGDNLFKLVKDVQDQQWVAAYRF